LNGGKLCEAVFTVIKGWLDGGQYPARSGKPSRFAEACLALERQYQRVPKSRSPRILIPRMMVGLYDIRNNRGVGHAGTDVDPNHMDATVVLYTAKWLMAELVRLLHTLSVEEATTLVDDLMEREVSWVWTHHETKRVLRIGLTWKQQTLILLLTEKGTVPEADLLRWLEHKSATDYRKAVLSRCVRADSSTIGQISARFAYCPRACRRPRHSSRVLREFCSGTVTHCRAGPYTADRNVKSGRVGVQRPACGAAGGRG
jgi:hypothetical protein